MADCKLIRLREPPPPISLKVGDGDHAGERGATFDRQIRSKSERSGAPDAQLKPIANRWQIDREDKSTMLEVSEQLEHLKLAAEVAGLKVPRFTLPQDHDVVVNQMRFHYLAIAVAALVER
jgi:hypothetical protein